MKNKILIQGGIAVIQTAIFPYYLLFLKNIGETYGTFALLYGVFALLSGVTYLFLSFLPTKPSIRALSVLSFSGLSLCMLFVPFATSVFHVCLIQCFMGIFQATYKISEKEWVKNESIPWTKDNIGQFILQMIILVTILVTGFLLDIFSIEMLFWTAVLLYGINAFLSFFSDKKDAV